MAHLVHGVVVQKVEILLAYNTGNSTRELQCINYPSTIQLTHAMDCVGKPEQLVTMVTSVQSVQMQTTPSKSNGVCVSS